MTADGRVVTPVSAFEVSPLGKVGFVLLCAQLIVFSTGAVIVTDHVVTQRACHGLRGSDESALGAFVGVPVPAAAAAFGAPAPIVQPGAPLVAGREVQGALSGLRFVAAYVHDLSGRLVGPAVWRIVDPGTVLNPTSTPDVSAQDVLARRITPSTGYGSSTPEDPGISTARKCAKAAR